MSLCGVSGVHILPVARLETNVIGPFGLNGWRRQGAREMAELNTAVAIDSPERVVSRWVDAFNARDLEGMLAFLTRDVALYPVKLGGLEACYRGHDGVRCWFAQLERHAYTFTISLSELQAIGGGRVFATGS